MKFNIGQMVYYQGEVWEIFLYVGGKYSIWNRESRLSVQVSEEEIDVI